MSDQARRRAPLGVILAAFGLVSGWIAAGAWWASRVEAAISDVQEDIGDLKSDVRLLLDGQRQDRIGGGRWSSNVPG